jgi:hypothetical protein
MRFTTGASLLAIAAICLWPAVELPAARASPPDLDQRGAAPPAPPPPPNPNLAPTDAGTGSISGVVIDGTTKAPLPGVVVYLGPPQHGPPGAPLRQLTDAKGRFIFRGLPAHSGYFINASKFGYFDGHYGRGSSGALGARIALTDGQWFSDANLTMWRPAAINGRVIDQLGEPVVGIYVRVLTKILVAGREQLAAGPVATTDDRGVYRIANLAPGRYVVQVPSVQATLPTVVQTVPLKPGMPPPPDPTTTLPTLEIVRGSRLALGTYATPLPPENGRTSAYPPTFYPGATSFSSATVFELSHGEDRTGIDVRLDPVPTFIVAGRLDGPPEALANLLLRLMPAGLEGLGDGSEVATALAGADGAFTFLSVPAGTYTLEARRTMAQFESRALIGVSTSLPRPPGLQFAGGGGGSVLSAPSGTSMTSRSFAGGDEYWGKLSLAVEGADLRDVVVPLRRAVTMRGRIVWEGIKPPMGIPVLRLEPANGNPALGQPRTTPDQRGKDTFVIDGLLPGEYVLAGIGARVKSVMWNGRDYTHRSFDAASGQDIDDVVITVTDQSILLTGAVRDDRGTASDDPAVIVFPVERELWTNFGFSPARLKAIQTTNAGRYTFQSLPAGDYYAIAVDAEHIDGWKDPAFLARAAPLATRISLAWGDRLEHNLTAVTVK